MKLWLVILYVVAPGHTSPTPVAYYDTMAECVAAKDYAKENQEGYHLGFSCAPLPTPRGVLLN